MPKTRYEGEFSKPDTTQRNSIVHLGGQLPQKDIFSKLYYFLNINLTGKIVTPFETISKTHLTSQN